jgi:type IV pilus assembly protein PilM
MVRFPFKRRQGVLVVEVGKADLKLAYLLLSPSKLELLSYSLHKICVEEKDPEGQITSLIQAFLRDNSISVKQAVLSIADTECVAIKYCLLPPLKRKEVLAAAVWQLKDEVHFDLERAYSDWRVVKEFTDEQGARQQGIIFAFSRKEAVEKYVDCLSKCNLRAQAIVTSALNYIDVLKGTTQEKPFNCEIILDLGQLDSALHLYVDRKLRFTRYMPVSVDSFTKALIGTLLSDKGKVELTLSDAEEIRDNIGIPQDDSAFIRDNLRAGQINSLIRPVLENLVREIRHSITYLVSHLEEPQPQVIYIAGLGAHLKGLDTYLTKELGLPVVRLAFPAILDTNQIEPEKLAGDSGKLVSCVGAVLLAARGITLLPGDLRMRWVKHALIKRLKPFVSALGILILSFMLISIFMLPVYSYRLKMAKDYFKDKKQLYSFFEKVRLWRELAFETSLQRVPADALLNFLSQSIPDGLCLNGLELDQYRGELTLQGERRQASDLDIFLEKLRVSGFFLSLKPLASSGDTFKIKCKLKY